MTKRLFTLLIVLCALAGGRAQERFAPVVNPKTPSSVTFDNERIDLTVDDRRERFERELISMIYSHINTLGELKRANWVFPILKPILKSNGVPEDFVYLACIESHLNPTAVSSAKAAGMWQFMPTTAREYGLEVNDNVDERYDIEKATEAACRYIKNARARYGDWMSVAASYNTGMGRISKELEAQQEESALNLWLSNETMRYMFRLLAAKALHENAATFGYSLGKDQLYTMPDCRIIEVTEPVEDWAVWAKEHGTNYYSVRRLNPWIRSKTLPNASGKVYKVRIPKA
ncbi:MAG: lytic transglycosylase domain-containing protein [Muribaculaceae bacterium]|nr:lytic transglycosylase domain-containing protein [Muribaculaceae bacterium]